MTEGEGMSSLFWMEISTLLAAAVLMAAIVMGAPAWALAIVALAVLAGIARVHAICIGLDRERD